MPKRYYIYLPQINQGACTIYDNIETACNVAIDFRNLGMEAEVCEFGYPFN